MNNQKIELLKWVPTPGEKHVGIAIVRYERRFIFRFRIQPSEHGGYWASAPAVKLGIVNGKDKYDPAFSLDSDYEKQELTDFVLAAVDQAMQQANPSVFHPNAQQQRPVAHQGYNSGSVAQGQAQQNPNAWGNAQPAPQSMDETLPF